MGRTSLAIANLRALTIVLVVSFHSVLAYLASQPAVQPSFDSPPYSWRAFPILDEQRWLGFDLYCAFLYVFLMPLMFFMSGLFVWGSLRRKGAWAFLRDRLVRIGIPFVVVAAVLMPLAHYPVYRVTAADPSWSAFWTHWVGLPFWAVGPLWFLWQLLVLDCAAAAVFRFAPGFGEYLAQLLACTGEAPWRYILGLIATAAIAYLPLAALFRPWEWSQFGPFSVQSGQVLLFIVYFFAGVGIGANGLERGILKSDGRFAQNWALWLGLAAIAFMCWLVSMAQVVKGVAALQLIANLFFALSSVMSCLAFVAVFHRFADRPIAVAGSLSENAYGIYLVHYLFVIWLQYGLLGAELSALAKGAIVLAGALSLSWMAAIALRHAPVLGRLIFEQRRQQVLTKSAIADKQQIDLRYNNLE